MNPRVLFYATFTAFVAIQARMQTIPPHLPPGVQATHPAGSPLRAALRPVPESAIFRMDGRYTSENGIDYDLVSQVPVWSQADPVPLAGGGSLRVAGIERPQVVLGDNGRPLALLVSAYPEIKESEPTFIILRPMDLGAPSHPSP